MSVGAVEEQTESTESTESEDTESTDAGDVGDSGAGEERTPVDNPSRPNRAQRRAERADQHNARAENAKLIARLEAEAERSRNLESSVAEMRGYMQAQRQRETTPADDTDAKIAKLEDEADRHLLNASQARHPEVAKEEMRSYKQKLRQAAVLDARREFSGEFEKFRQSVPNQQQTATQTQLASEFPWFGTNTPVNRAAAMFAGELEVEMIRSGKPPGVATARAAMAEAAKHFGIGGRAAPGPGATNPYSGVSSREGAAGSASGNVSQRYSADRMSKDEKRQAEQSHPRLEPALAWNAWAKAMNSYFAKNGGG